MKLQNYSDLHLEFGDFRAPDLNVDVVILAGDIHVEALGVAWAKEMFKDKPVLYVPGNHEYYSSKTPVQKIDAEMKAAAAGSNVHVLMDEVFVLGDIRFLGGTLWTDFRLYGDPVLAAEHARSIMQDYKWSHILDRNAQNGYSRRMRPADTYAWHCDTKAFLKRELAKPWSGKTVVVTHHAPCEQAIPAQFRGDSLSACFASDMESLMTPAVNLWVFGHTHQCRDFKMHGTRLVSNQRGYAPHQLVDNFDEGFVLEI